MRLLLDECVPKRLKQDLHGRQFDVLLTVDQGIEYQQNLSGLSISVVVMMAPSNDVDDLRPLLPGVQEALAKLRPEEIIRVGG